MHIYSRKEKKWTNEWTKQTHHIFHMQHARTNCCSNRLLLLVLLHFTSYFVITHLILSSEMFMCIQMLLFPSPSLPLFFTYLDAVHLFIDVILWYANAIEICWSVPNSGFGTFLSLAEIRSHSDNALGARSSFSTLPHKIRQSAFCANRDTRGMYVLASACELAHFWRLFEHLYTFCIALASAK